MRLLVMTALAVTALTPLGTAPAQASTVCVPYVGTTDTGVMGCVQVTPLPGPGYACVFVVTRTPGDPYQVTDVCVPY